MATPSGKAIGNVQNVANAATSSSSKQGSGTILIQTRSRSFWCSPKEIIPRRLGAVHAKGLLLVEYAVPTHELKRAVRRIKIGAEAATSATEAVDAVREAHRPWLEGVPQAQLHRFVQDLLLAFNAPQEGDAQGSAADHAASTPETRPITVKEVEELQDIVFGRDKAKQARGLPKEWLQGWCFETDAQATCPYGLRQVEGGPCGIISVGQAFMLRRLLMNGLEPASATTSQATTALLEGLADVLVQCAASDGKVKVLVPQSKLASAPQGLLRSPADCTVCEFLGAGPALRKSLAENQQFIEAYLGDEHCAGVPLFLYSALMTHGIERIRDEADEAGDTGPCMLGAHGYCTQEAVNLLATGIASSNIFDGERWLGEAASGDRLRLGGILAQSEVGLLSLFEAYDQLEVGQNYKRPRWPVWLIHAESHYSVAFSLALRNSDSAPDSDGGSQDDERERDVWYYDPLGRQDEEKRITVTPNGLSEPPEEDDLEENGMIAKVLRTRWGKRAGLNWNGAEPIF